MSAELLLNDGVSNILLNDGVSVLLLNGEEPLVLKVGGRWFGTSTSTKPTLTTDQAGHEFYESDSPFDKFIWSGSAWELQV